MLPQSVPSFYTWMNTLLSVTDLAIGYGCAVHVEGVSLSLQRGEVLAVIGSNGSGKSTLLKTLLGYLPPLAGSVDWAQRLVSVPNQPTPNWAAVAYLGQQREFDFQFPLRVKDLVAMGAWSKMGLLGRMDRACQRRVQDALLRAGIAKLANLPLYHLSSGQLQRALFARMMVQDASLVLLDEPFAAVDQATESSLLALINEWAMQQRAVVVVLHDLSTVLQYCRRVLLIGKGRSLFGEAVDVLTPDNLVEFDYLSASQVSWFERVYKG